MDIIKEEDVCLPIFSNDKDIRAKRKEKYIEMGNAVYPNAPTITKEEYNEIKSKLSRGDKSVLPRLIELSISSINEAVANIFAHYDLDEVVPYNEALSYCLDRFSYNLQNYKELPNYCAQFQRSLISISVFRSITKMYSYSFVGKTLVEPMSKQEVIWIQDQQDYDELDLKSIDKEELFNLIKRASVKLTPKQERAVKLKFGFETGEELTFSEVGRICNMTRGGAMQLVVLALRNFRKCSKGLNKYLDGDLEV